MKCRVREATRDTAGKPLNYNITQGEVELFPTPDATYNLEMYYYGKIPALTAANPTNAILTNFPDVYLYGSLMHSAPFLVMTNACKLGDRCIKAR